MSGIEVSQARGGRAPARGQRAGEAERLTALREVGLLDHAPVAAFERLARLVGELLRVPVALVSLVAEDRQVFAGAYGLPEPWAHAGETALSHSLCRHVVERNAALVIQDARASPLVAENLAV